MIGHMHLLLAPVHHDRSKNNDMKIHLVHGRNDRRPTALAIFHLRDGPFLDALLHASWI